MNKQIIRDLYNSAYDYTNYTQNMTKGHDRLKISVESINEYVEELDIKKLNKPMKFLLIGQLDCTDTAVALPAFTTIAKKMSEWEFKVHYKQEISKTYDYKEIFGVGAKQTNPQILILDNDLNYITRWWDKSLSKKVLLKKLTEKGFVGEERKKKIADTPELNIRYEAKMVVNEILGIIEKSIHYL